MEFKNQYLTYAEYKKLEGELQEMPFNILELEARQNINKYTFGRLVDLTEQRQETKLCMFNLINLLNSYEADEGHDKSISSESTDGYSVTYAQPNESSPKAKQIAIKGIIENWLCSLTLENGTPYLYRGV